jgi:hypothetical protein
MLKIFDSLGSEIETLINQEYHAGKHEMLFIAEKYVSGVYFYTLQIDDIINTKKMILIR